MLKLNNIEFYNTPSGSVMVSIEGQEAFMLLPTHYDLISILHDYIMQNYHGAYLALSSLYKGSAQNPSYYRYRIVSRFARCNFGEYETNVVDISKHTFHFEQVHCPLRGTGDCQLEKVVCNPQYTLPLTEMSKFKLIIRWVLLPLWLTIFIVYLPIWYLLMSWYYFSFQDYWESYLVLWDRVMITLRLKKNSNEQRRSYTSNERG